MPFRLSRGGNNIAAEVQRWQYFLLRRAIPQVGSVDAEFGMKTQEGTRVFQLQNNIPTSGKLDARTLEVAESLGYTVLPDDYYDLRKGAAWPAPPGDLASPNNQWRNANLGCFQFVQRAQAFRDRIERIVIRGDCAGTTSDWSAANIVDLHSTAFAHATGFRGRFTLHAKAREAMEELLVQWKSADLLHLVISYAGAFDPRYIFGFNAGNAAQPARRSTDAQFGGKLSNHAFGSAFDINASMNWIGDEPARCGKKGSVRELVEAANRAGFYWGGHFRGGRIDGMHFELARL